MKISPISFYNFGRKANKEEMNSLKKAVSVAKERYSKLEALYIANSSEGLRVLGNAAMYGRFYAREKAGEMADILENQASAYPIIPSPNKKEKKETKETLMLKSATEQYEADREKGFQLYLQSHPKENEILTKTMAEFASSEDGAIAIKTISIAENNLKRALVGEDIEDIISE